MKKRRAAERAFPSTARRYYGSGWLKLLLAFCSTLALFETASGVEFSEVQTAGKRVTVCRVDPQKERLRLFLKDDLGQPFKRFERLNAWLQPRGQKLVFAMNGGMYERDFSPVGLFVADSQQVTSLNTTNGEGNFFLKPNGVFLITEKGARIVETSEYPALRERIILATQSGPLLVRRGKVHPAFRPNSENRLIRNGVGVSAKGEVVFAISEVPVSFHEFATLYRDSLDCPDALFFDGVVSSLHSSHLKRNDQKVDLGPIIAVTE